MARRFVRVDLSDRARDFRPIAIEPGVPLLDPSNANARIVFKWLGGAAAEPEWEQDAVSFYVRDDHGGRLENVTCQPAADADLEGPLKADFEALRQRLAKAAPETATERAVHRILTQSFARIADDLARTDRDDYFFRYRDAAGRMRLVWCWGYQRVDQEPAASVICSDPDCGLLFVRRPGQSPKCPACEALLLTKPPARMPWKRMLLVGLLFFLLGGGLVYWYLNRNQLVVTPEQLQLIVGEIADLDVRTPSDAPIEMTSSNPSVVELTGENRLIGRREGTAQVDVRQAGRRRTVDVTVTQGEIRSIALDPARVAVAVDHRVPVRVMGQTGAGRTIELAPDGISLDKRPSPRYATVDPATLEVRGILPTEEDSPQHLALRFQDRVAEAAVQVFVAPFRLESAPSGSVDLPLGQMTSLFAWADYEDGLRVHVPPGRVQWQSDSSGSAAGLELRGDRVVALQSGGGPLEVRGSYLGRESDPVVFRSVEAAPIGLRLDVDRTLRLAGEPGRVMLLGTGPKGDVELAPEMAQFESSDAGVLKIDQGTGMFRAAAPGEVTVTARHAAAAEPSSVRLRVVDPADARLVFEPADVRLAVDEVARLELFLEARVGDQAERAVMAGPEVRWWMAEPDAVAWRAPLLFGKRPAGPFEIGAGYLPYLGTPAAAQIEVLAAGPPSALRVVPSQAALAAGQTLALAVEEQLSPDGQWREVRPDAVAWTAPRGVLLTRPTEGLRAAATVREGAAGQMELLAEYRGQQATATIEAAEPQLDPAERAVQLVLQREPEGRYLPVGHNQRYSIWLEKDGVTEPAADVRWPADFENEFVRWQAPVLAAERAGYGQWLEAEVGGRTLRFHTYTVDPSLPTAEPLPREDLPAEVVIESDQGPAVQFPVGAEFDDFRVEARYPDGFTRIVTKKAALETPLAAEQSPVAFSGGRMLGIRPGQTRVEASFDGVRAKNPLGVEVTAGVELDEIRLRPAPLGILPGETIGMEAVGYRGGRSVGVLTSMAGIQWQSDNPSAVAVNGPMVTGRQLGQAAVTARLGSVLSQPAMVNVVASIADPLVVDQESMRMRVGESRRIGSDVQVFRGETDLSGQAYVSSSLPGVVRYVPETHSLLGVSPGVAAVTFSWGDKLATTMVEVLPGGTLEGEVVVEPAAGVLAPGQALDLRVYLLSSDGYRIDRTDSAVFTSAAPGTISMRGSQACALGPGTAEILAQLPESAEPGRAYLAVNDEEITDLIVEPAEVRLSVGDTERLRVLGRAASGTHELFAQPPLSATVGGTDPQAVQVVGSRQIDALAAGEAEVAVTWEDRLRQTVPVAVTDDPITDLAIDPLDVVVHPGQTLVYQVTGVRGGRRRVLSAADGLQMYATEPSVAQVAEDTAVVATASGRTGVVAQAGRQQAEASLTVTPADGPGGSVVYGPGGSVIYGPGYGRYGSGYDVIYGRGRRVVYGPDGVVVYGPDGAVVSRPGYSNVYLPPSADAVGLRFIPEMLRVPTGSPGVPVDVVEVLADGSLGRSLTADPNLEFTEPPEVAAVERSDGGAIIRPVSPGETRIAAKLGTLLTETPLLVQVGDQPADSAWLDVVPQVLDLWVGEVATFRSVAVSPGFGQMPYRVDYRVSGEAGQGVVAVEGEQMIRALGDGVSHVTVTAVDPSGRYDGLSTIATVRVGTPDRLWIEPPAAAIEIGQSTPPFTVMARAADGLVYQVPAVLESGDPNILVADARIPGAFRATGLGATQVRALYRSREALAEVTITGRRFVDVRTTLDEGEQEFGVTVEVLAVQSEGALEYRIYSSGQTPPDRWVPNEPLDGRRRVVLRSPQIPYGDRTARYGLVLEARSLADGSVQRYPFTFRLAPNIERTDTPR